MKVKVKSKKLKKYRGCQVLPFTFYPLLSLPLRLGVSAVTILVLSLCYFAQTRASQGWTWQNPLPQGNPLYSINFARDKENGFAVGSYNTILHTDDGGFHWDRQI